MQASDFDGSRLFSVRGWFGCTSATEQTIELRADDEWKARTRFMAVTHLRLRGEMMNYEVREIS